MNNQTFTEALSSQILDGNCNILSGMMVGSLISLRYIIMIMVLMVIYSCLNFWLKELFKFIRSKLQKTRTLNNNSKRKIC